MKNALLSCLFMLSSVVLNPLFITSTHAAEGAFTPTEYSQIRLVADHTQAVAGQEITLGWHIQMEKNWHVYWKNPGDSGLPPEIEFTTASSQTPLEQSWPTPERFAYAPLLNYGYGGNLYLPYTLKIPNNWPSGTPYRVKASGGFLICYDVCLPAEGVMELSIPVSDTAIANSTVQRAFNNQNYPNSEMLSINATQTATELFIPLASLGSINADIHYIPDTDGLIEDFTPQRVQDGFLIVKRDLWNDIQNPSIGGLLVNGAQSYLVTLALTKGAAPVSAAPAGGQITEPTFLFALFSAFIAGLILNLMPCVLPVVSLKVFSLVKHAHGKIIPHTLAFGAGVISLFWVLAGLVVLLKSTGTAVGWGFHLQNPIAVATLTFLLVAVALNLFGIFNFGNSLAAKAGAAELELSPQGLTSSFFSGALVTLVATPCTVPFMGGAVAYGLSASTLTMFAIFTAMGLGLASPYIALAYSPKLLKKLPKPGAWMDTFKQFLGFPMLVTALWLIWVYSGQASQGAASPIALTLALLIWAFGLWLYGKLQTSKPKRAALYLIIALAISALPLRTNQHDTATITWQTWSAAAVETALANNQPVFVNFTADWCITCKATERLVLNTKGVADLFAAEKVVALKADWTAYDAAITLELERFGRKGVPLYLVYLPQNPNAPQILPQLLSLETLSTALTN